jgi:hypothetical protein
MEKCTMGKTQSKHEMFIHLTAPLGAIMLQTLRQLCAETGLPLPYGAQQYRSGVESDLFEGENTASNRDTNIYMVGLSFASNL